MSEVGQEGSSLAVVLNGEARSIRSVAIPDLLCELGQDPATGGIAVAINASVVPRSQWTEVRIRPGDHIEIVGARQGG